jgi:hypothetical protein
MDAKGARSGLIGLPARLNNVVTWKKSQFFHEFQ